MRTPTTTLGLAHVHQITSYCRQDNQYTALALSKIKHTAGVCKRLTDTKRMSLLIGGMCWSHRSALLLSEGRTAPTDPCVTVSSTARLLRQEPNKIYKR